mgnify:CR=1 FL=1
MRARRKKRIGYYVIALAVLIICAVASYSKYSLDRKYEALQKQKEALELSIEEEAERSKEIEEYSVYVKTKKFVIDVARDILGLTEPDDIVIKEGESSE